MSNHDFDWSSKQQSLDKYMILAVIFLLVIVKKMETVFCFKKYLYLRNDTKNGAVAFTLTLLCRHVSWKNPGGLRNYTVDNKLGFPSAIIGL